jgi:hypothetical protein
MTRCCEVVQNGARATRPETVALRLRPETRDNFVPQAVEKLGMSIGALH